MADRLIQCEWGPGGVGAGRAPAAVVVADVLIFSTAVAAALDHGVLVHPYRWGDARAAAAHAQSVGAVLAARRGESEPSASPGSLRRVAAGCHVVLPSPNGATCALAARQRGPAVQVALGALVNAAAVARWAAAAGGPVRLIAAGERWPDGSLRPALEDWLGVGAVAAHLPWDQLDDSARAARAAFESARPTLAAVLAGTPSGQELIGRGFADDVEWAAQSDRHVIVPVLGPGGYFEPAGPRPL